MESSVCSATKYSAPPPPLSCFPYLSCCKIGFAIPTTPPTPPLPAPVHRVDRASSLPGLVTSIVPCLLPLEVPEKRTACPAAGPNKNAVEVVLHVASAIVPINSALAMTPALPLPQAPPRRPRAPRPAGRGTLGVRAIEQIMLLPGGASKQQQHNYI